MHILIDQVTFSQVKFVSKLEKMQEMASQRFLVLLGVENNIPKVCQNPPIRKLLNWGGGAKGGFQRINRKK